MSNEITIKLIGNYSYQTSHCLGEGVYGKVYEGKDDQTKERVAIKKIDLNTFTNDKYLENAIFSEIYLLKRFNHTNIVRFKDVLTSKNSLYIITEFCKSGDLREIIKRRRFKEEEAFEVVRQILSGFTQLVQEKIIHRDLKPANILVNEGVYKIADFGFAKYVDNFGTQMLKSCVGSPIYMAPQILERAPYTTKCDIWSIGIIFYQMLFGYPPWKARDEAELLRALKMMPIHQIVRREASLSPKAADFLRRCLAYYEDDRANWNQLFELYLNKERTVTPVVPMASHPFEDSPMKGGDNSGRNRYISVANGVSIGSGPTTVRNNGNVLERRQSLQQLPPLQPPTLAPGLKNNSVPTPGTPSYLTNPHKRSSLNNNNNPIDVARVGREECVLKHYLCVQLYTSLQLLRDFFTDSFKQERLIYALANSTKVKSASCMSIIAPQIKQTIEQFRNNRSLEQMLRKMDKEHQNYEELEADITREFDKLQTIKRIRQDLAPVLFSKNELLSDEKASKLESNGQLNIETLYRLLCENCQLLCNEMQKRGVTVSRNSFQLVQLLDWMYQLVVVLNNKDKLMELSLVSFTMQQSDPADLLNRTLNKVLTYLNNN